MRGPSELGRHLAEGGEELLFGGGDERGEVGGDAGVEEGLACAAVALGVGLEEVDAGEAVDLEVDEAGDGDAAAVGRRRGRSPRSRPSSTSTSPRTRRPSTSAASTPSLIARPPAGCSARPCRAARGLRRRRSRRGGRRSRPCASPSGRRERGVDLVPGCAGRGADDAADARAQLLVRRGDVDHEVAVRLAEPDHRDRREHVEDELLRRPGLEPRRAGEELGADDDDDRMLGDRLELGARRPRRRRPWRARCGRSLERARRRRACGRSR